MNVSFVILFVGITTILALQNDVKDGDDYPRQVFKVFKGLMINFWRVFGILLHFYHYLEGFCTSADIYQ